MTHALHAPQDFAPDKDGKRWMYFYCSTGPGMHRDIHKMIVDGDGYDSIEELINSLPISKLQKDQLPKRVAFDFGLGLGKDYPEFGVVAYAGGYVTMKPIASYKHGDGTKYVKHPQIDLMLQRYV